MSPRAGRTIAKLPVKPKQNASANAEASSFSRFEDFRPPHVGKTSLAVTKYCVPLRLHRQGDIRMGESGCRRRGHDVFMHRMAGF